MAVPIFLAVSQPVRVSSMIWEVLWANNPNNLVLLNWSHENLLFWANQSTWLSLLTQCWANLATIYLVLIQPSYYYWPNLTTNQSPLLSLWYRPIHAESCNNKFIQSRITRIITFLFSMVLHALANSKDVSINGTKDPKFDFNSNPV